MKERNHLHIFSILLLFAIFGFTPVAQAQYWCGYPINPPNPGPPPPPCCECTGDCTASPNMISIGNYFFSVTDLSLPTRGFSLTMTRNYDSSRILDGPFGKGWTSSLTGSLQETTYLYAAPSTYYKEVTVLLPNGRPYAFRQNPDGSYTSHPATNQYKLVKNVDGTFDLTPPQSRTKYKYSVTGLLTSQVDEFGNNLVFTYNANGRLDRVTDGTGSGRYLEFIYGADGRVSTLRDSANRTVTYAYNAQGAMTSATNAASKQTTYEYVNGRFGPLLNVIKDHWNRVITTVTYDSADRTATYTDAGETYTYTYHYNGDPFTVLKKDSGNVDHIFTFDANGRVTSRVMPYTWGTTTTTVFNADGSIQNSIDEVGVKTSYTYHPNGTVATITRDDQGPQTIRFDYAYDPNFPEKVISITPKNPATNAVDPNWQAWRYDYYQAGSTAPGALFHVYRVRSDGSTLDTLATYTYNVRGQVLTVSDGAGAVTTYAYHATTGDLTSVTYPKNSTAGANPVYEYARDAVGRVTSATVPGNISTTYTYDNIDRILTVTLPKPTGSSTLNFVTTYTYDVYDSPTGLLFTHQTDPNGKITKQGYDQFGQMVRSIDALNKTTVFTYTKGLLTSITDANNNVTNYAYYTGLPRLATTTFPDGTTENYSYFKDGLLENKWDRKNQLMIYSYDHLKRLVSKNLYLSNSITYSYAGQRLISVSDGFGAETHSFTYDPSYRIATHAQGFRGTLTYTYDAADRVATSAVLGGPTATYAYYADGSLKNVQWTPVAGQFDYTYLLRGPYNRITFPNASYRQYTYDNQSRMTQVQTKLGSTNIANYVYGYDVNQYTGQNTMLGQRSLLTMTVPAQSISNKQFKYYYDGNYQLDRVVYPNVAPFNSETHSWTYDDIGNRLTSTVNASTANYTYYKNGSNPLNGQRLQSDGTKTYTYDNNGNMIGDGTYTFTWDHENRMTGITGGGLTTSYSYDYLGRRKSKTVNGVTTTYLYDGQNLVREMAATNTDYLFGPGIDEPLAQNSSGATRYYITDALGSVGLLRDASGSPLNTYLYDAWGVQRSQTGTLANPFTYTAREVGEAGLMFYRARYYNPSIGRFVSEDELRYKASVNFYAYVVNDPISFRDPLGLLHIGSPTPVPSGPVGWLTCFYNPQICFELPDACVLRISKQESEISCKKRERNDRSCRKAHCVTNCRIVRECKGGSMTAIAASYYKEITDIPTKEGYSGGDQCANEEGRQRATQAGSCDQLCSGCQYRCPGD